MEKLLRKRCLAEIDGDPSYEHICGAEYYTCSECGNIIISNCKHAVNEGHAMHCSNAPAYESGRDERE